MAMMEGYGGVLEEDEGRVWFNCLGVREKSAGKRDVSVLYGLLKSGIEVDITRGSIWRAQLLTEPSLEFQSTCIISFRLVLRSALELECGGEE